MSLPLFQQETPYSCIPACLRIALAYFGKTIDEDELRQYSYTTLWGTSTTDAAACVARYGLEARLEHGSIPDLQDWIKSGFVPMLVIRLASRGKHAIVIENLKSDQILYVDPADGTRHSTQTDIIISAWQAAGSEALLMRLPAPT